MKVYVENDSIKGLKTRSMDKRYKEVNNKTGLSPLRAMKISRFLKVVGDDLVIDGYVNEDKRIMVKTIGEEIHLDYSLVVENDSLWVRIKEGHTIEDLIDKVFKIGDDFFIKKEAEGILDDYDKRIRISIT